MQEQTFVQEAHCRKQKPKLLSCINYPISPVHSMQLYNVTVACSDSCDSEGAAEYLGCKSLSLKHLCAAFRVSHRGSVGLSSTVDSLAITMLSRTVLADSKHPITP